MSDRRAPGFRLGEAAAVLALLAAVEFTGRVMWGESLLVQRLWPILERVARAL